MKMGKTFKRYMIAVLAFVFIGIGSAFTIKANIGLGAWDAIANSVANLFHAKIGTIGMIFNCSCIAGQLVILRTKFRPVQLLQIPVSILLGTVVNFVFYNLLTFPLDNYILRIIVCVGSLLFVAFAVSVIMIVDAITCPLEAFCMALTDVLPFKFHVLRQAADVLCILAVFVLTLVFKVPLTLGLGTIIGMLIFGPALGKFMKMLYPVMKRMGLTA